MKKWKLIVFALIVVIFFSSLQVSSIKAQEDISTFGVETKTFDVLQQAQDANNHWLRYNGLLWSEYQPNNAGQFISNPELEADMIATSAAGMEMILVIRSTPTWARKYPDFSCGPMKEGNIQDFANFMYDVVEKYSQPPYNVKYFELWNEPDEYRNNIDPEYQMFGCWGEPSEPYFGGQYYGDMLTKVYKSVKAANSNAQVVLGGLLLPCKTTTNPYCNMSKFFEGVLKNGGDDYFDVVNFHGYTTYDTRYPTGIVMEREEVWWSNDGGQVEGKLAFLRELMGNYGISNKPILQTEAALALPYDFNGDMEKFEAIKADYLVYVFIRNIDIGIKGTTWYHIDNYGWRKSGLLDGNNKPLPAYTAYQVMTKTLDGAVYQGELGLGDGIYGYEFLNGSNRFWVLFSEYGNQRTINKPVWFSHAYNLLKQGVTQTDTTISFDRPIFIDNIPNTAPKFESEPIEFAIQDRPYVYNIKTGYTEPENFDVHKITSVLSLPSWLTLRDHGDGTATLSGTPNIDHVGKHVVELLVTDSGGLTSRQKFTIYVYRPEDVEQIFLPLILR